LPHRSWAMNILAIAGSPRRGGNTDTMLDYAIAGATSQGARVENVILSSLKISPCIECNRCYESGVCVIQDDFQQVYARTLAADGVILAAPVFFMNVSGVTKASIDRFQCLWALKYILKQKVPPPPGGGRRSALFLSAAGTQQTKFDGTLLTVRAFFATIDAKMVGKLCVSGIDNKGDVVRHPELLQQSRELGALLASGQATMQPPPGGMGV
jgi:multimeric flavodoxin WrbA